MSRSAKLPAVSAAPEDVTVLEDSAEAVHDPQGLPAEKNRSSSESILLRFLHGHLTDPPREIRDRAAYEAIRGIEAFRNLGSALDLILRARDLELLRIPRDEIVDTAGAAFFIVEGQIALASFPEARRLGEPSPGGAEAWAADPYGMQGLPLNRRAERNIAWFGPGDLVGLNRLPANLRDVCSHYSLTQVKLLRFAQGLLDRLAQAPALAQWLAESRRRERMQLDRSASAARLLTDFYIRNGLSIATSLKIIDLNKCNECRQCEIACAERHGESRLSIKVKGKALGVVGLADSCRTCVEKRCVEACQYQAIAYHKDKKEVVIKAQSCTGCSLCAQACPYGAIAMHELEQSPPSKDRPDAEDSLKAAQPQAQLDSSLLIAAKCDHCADYRDEACVTRCPTTALMEIRPDSLLAATDEAIHSQRFFKVTPLVDKGRRGAARMLGTYWLWVLSLVGLSGCMLEVALRHFFSGVSLLALYMIYVQGAEPVTAAHYARGTFRPGSGFALALGILGTLLIFSAALYSAFLRLPWLLPKGKEDVRRGHVAEQCRRLFGSLGYHLWAGTLGAALITLHTAFVLSAGGSIVGVLATAAFWLMAVLILSGLMGCYLSAESLKAASRAALLSEDIRNRLTELRRHHTGVRPADRCYESFHKHYKRAAKRSAWAALGMLLADELIRPLRVPLFRFLLAGVPDAAGRAELACLFSWLLYLNRQAVLLPAIQPLVGWWRSIHVPAMVALALLICLHIATALCW